VNNGACSPSRANISVFDVRIDDIGVGGIRLEIGGSARGGGTGTTGDTWGRWIRVGREIGVEPEHIDSVVVPERKNEDHSLFEASGHGRKSAFGLEAIRISKRCLLLRAEFLSDRIKARVDARNIDMGVGNGDAVLDVETSDFTEST